MIDEGECALYCERYPKLTAERDAALEMNEVLHNQCGVVERAFVKLTAERDALKRGQEVMGATIAAAMADNERLRAEVLTAQQKAGELRKDISVVMKERRDALQRAWNAEPEVERLRGELATANDRLSSRGITELTTLFTALREAAEELAYEALCVAEPGELLISKAHAVLAKLKP